MSIQSNILFLINQDFILYFRLSGYSFFTGKKRFFLCFYMKIHSYMLCMDVMLGHSNLYTQYYDTSLKAFSES